MPFVLWVGSTAASWWRLRHVPGPRLASFSWLWSAWRMYWGQAGDYEHLSRYGPVVRVGPNQVVVDDPGAFRQINGARSLAARDTCVKFDYKQDTTFTSLEIGPHDKLKAKASFAYSGRDGVDLEASVDRTTMYLVQVIRRRHLSAGEEMRELDFAKFIRYFTMDLIADVGYGERFGFLDGKDDEYRYTDSVEKLTPLIAFVADVPVLRRLFVSPLTAPLFAPTAKDSIAQDIILRRFAADAKEHNDMVGAWMRHGMDKQEVLAESLIQVIAGSDTTATAIRSTMLYITATPRVYQRLKEELRRALASGVASSPITNAQAKELPYFQAVVWEGIRMRPSVTLGVYKIVPPGGSTLCGVPIPGGTAVGFNAIAMMRRPDVFGQDARLFRPERFLECDARTKMERIRTVELAFGHGRWMCAGKTLALLELNKIFFELLKAFDFQLVYPGSAWHEGVTTAYHHKDMWVRITEATTSD
ncbi:Cytochrome P450 monooxygenase lolP1 [Apiospora marii]|uniref:Cytochrome P450 monooxygenase lolP1 n=1 Tax=Apiospora marii TaxID=335849 RepID=UPI0031300BDB